MKYIWNRLSITTGVRYDNVPYNKTSVFAPRIGLSYSITPVTKYNVAYGTYYQSPNYWILMNPNNAYRLKHTYTNQQVAGIEHYFADDIKHNVTNYDPHYLGSYRPFTKKTRFKDFNFLTLQKQLNDILIKKGSNLNIIRCYFPEKINDEILPQIKGLY